MEPQQFLLRKHRLLIKLIVFGLIEFRLYSLIQQKQLQYLTDITGRVSAQNGNPFGQTRRFLCQQFPPEFLLSLQNGRGIKRIFQFFQHVPPSQASCLSFA